MEQIKIYLEKMISLTGLTGDSIAVVRYAILVIMAFILAWMAGWACRAFIVPLLLKIIRKTDAKWDDVIFSEKVLRSASRIIPAIVIWALLPLVFYEFPKVEEIVSLRITQECTIPTYANEIHTPCVDTDAGKLYFLFGHKFQAPNNLVV